MSGSRLKQPVDPWSVREKLALACSVLRSGDQNWMSVSRAIRPFGESDRPEYWFAQKNCAQQYAELLETVETPKRKRGEREKEVVETPQLVIARKLTLERIEELRDVIKQQQEEYHKLRDEIEQINTGAFDKNLKELVQQIKQEEEEEAARLQQQQKEEKGDGDAAPATPTVGPASQQSSLHAPDTLLLPQTPATPVQPSTPVLQAPDTPSLPSPATEGDVVVETTVETSPMEVEQVEIETEETELEEKSATPSPPEPARVPTPKKERQEKTSEERNLPPINPIIIKGNQVFRAPVKTPISPVPKTPTGVTKSPATVPSTPTRGGENVALIKTEPAEEVEVDILAAETSDEGAHMSADTPQPEEKTEIKEESVDEPPATPKIKDEPTDGTAVPSTPASLHTPAPDVRDEDDVGPMSPASSVTSHSSAKPDRFGKSRRGRRASRGRRKKEERPAASELDTSDDDERSVSSTRLSYMDTTSSPASFTHEETDMDEKQYKQWKKSIILVWRVAANHKYANVFMHPVREDIAPGYSKIILRPMDLQSIKRRLESGEIRTTLEFQRDLMLMFTNALMYNSKHHDVYRMAQVMYADVMTSIEQYVSAQVLMPSAHVTPSNKLLRQSRRSETLSGGERSDKEDEIKKRRQSIDTDVTLKKKKN